MRQKRAFTLIELLVVIAIIAILAAILFPVFTRAKAAAKKTVCMSNLKQIGTSILLYMADYDDRFPYAVDAVDKFRPEIWDPYPNFRAQIPNMPLMHEVLQTYVKNYDVFKCPSDTGSQMLDTHPWMTFPASPSMFKQYGLSYMFRTEIAFRKMTHSELSDVAGVNVMMDGSGHWHEGERALTQSDWDNGESLEKRKLFRYNILYGDMHVKSVRDDVLTAAWATEL